MAERRMFAKSVVFYDVLPELPHSTQVLYMHLNMHADDDGLVGNPRPVMRLAQCTQQDLDGLGECGLVLMLPSGTVAITHWRVHNQIRRDRYHPTRLQKDFAQLVLTPEGTYRLRTEEDGCQTGNQLATQDRIGKDRLGKYRIDEDKAALPQSTLPRESSSHIDFEETVFSLYKQYCAGLLACNRLTKNLRRKIMQLQDCGWTLETIADAFSQAGQLDYLKGGGVDGWKADLEWLCTDDNLKKVVDGRYVPWKRKKEPVPMGGSEMGQAEIEAIRQLLGSEQLTVDS